MITRNELEAELREFLERLPDSINRIYGGRRTAHLSEKVEQTPLWKVLMRLHDYGVEGRPSGDAREGLGYPTATFESDAQDALFLLVGLDELEDFLAEDEVPVPRLARRVTEIAGIRHLLDGGERMICLSGDDSGIGAEHLSIAEIAMLADMDAKSVRNACNPKAADRLITEALGKRTGVPLAEARRWLAGRKGFKPTVYPAGEAPAEPVAPLPVQLSDKANQALRAEAAARGIDIDALVLETFASGRASTDATKAKEAA